MCFCPGMPSELLETVTNAGEQQALWSLDPTALSQLQVLAQSGNERQLAQTRPEAMLTPPREDIPSIRAN